MDNKGFTLVEIITTVALVSLLMLLVIPNLLSQVSSKKEDASDQEQKILIEAARAYVDKHHEAYETKTSDCISITMLEQEGLYSQTTRNTLLPANAGIQYEKNANGVETYTYQRNGC